MRKFFYYAVVLLIIGVASFFIYNLINSGIDPGVPAGAVKI